MSLAVEVLWVRERSKPKKATGVTLHLCIQVHNSVLLKNIVTECTRLYTICILLVARPSIIGLMLRL